MLRLAADENVKMAVIRGLRRRLPTLDLVRVQEVGLSGAPDEDVLAWAAEQGRILLTHDIKTVPPLAYARIAAGQPMPGVTAIPWDAGVGPVIDDLLLLIGATEPAEWQGLVEYLPL